MSEKKVMETRQQKPFTSKFNGVSIREVNKYTTYVGGVYLGRFKSELHAAWCFDEYILTNLSADKRWMEKLNKVTKPEDYVAAKIRKKAETHLPKGISFQKQKEKYTVHLQYLRKKYRFYSKNLEEALAQHQEFLKTIDIIKAENEEKTKLVPIERNTEGIAVIKTFAWQYLPVEERKSQEILVNDETWHQLMKYAWNINENGYAQTKDKRKTIRMNRMIMGYGEDNKNTHIDHINQNRIDNRIKNLRPLDKTDPMHKQNRGKQKKYIKSLSRCIME